MDELTVIITLTKQTNQGHTAAASAGVPPAGAGAGAPEMITVSRSALVEAMTAEILETFSDFRGGESPALESLARLTAGEGIGRALRRGGPSR